MNILKKFQTVSFAAGSLVWFCAFVFPPERFALYHPAERRQTMRRTVRVLCRGLTLHAERSRPARSRPPRMQIAAPLLSFE
jgi:hypothetical protein